jgi:formylmethanofuran dehydrogenase subunit B
MAEEEKAEEAEEVLAETDKCKIVKKDGRILAQCEGEEPRDLGQVIKKEEDCPGCAEAVAVGYALSYVTQENPYMANRIHEDVTSQKITSEEALDKCAKILEDSNRPELVETIKVLKGMMHKSLSELEKEVEEAEKSGSTG